MISSLGSYGGSDAAQWRQKLFSKADANGDSSLSKDELLSALKTGKQGKNGEDSSAIAEKLFSDMDSDQDGKVSQSDFTSFTPKFDAGTASALLSAQQGPPSAEDMLAETDSDGDGAISKEELAAVLKKHAESGQGPQGGPSVDEMFSSMDGDGDGSVSKDELSAFAAKGPQGPPPGGGAPPAGGAQSASGTSSTSTSYDAADTNKDGVVSLTERLAANQASAPSATTGNLSSSTLATLLQSVNEVAA